MIKIKIKLMKKRKFIVKTIEKKFNYKENKDMKTIKNKFQINKQFIDL